MKKNVSWSDHLGQNLESVKYIPIPKKNLKDNKENNDFISISPPIKIISPLNNYDWTNITMKIY